MAGNSASWVGEVMADEVRTVANTITTTITTTITAATTTTTTTTTTKRSPRPRTKPGRPREAVPGPWMSRGGVWCLYHLALSLITIPSDQRRKGSGILIDFLMALTKKQ